MTVDKCFEVLENTGNVGEYVIVYNLIFELFVSEFKHKNKIDDNKEVSVYKAV